VNANVQEAADEKSKESSQNGCNHESTWP
jgi:hypothetical protein